MRYIKLQGKYGGRAIIDDEDFALVSKYRWYLNDRGYAASAPGKTTKLLMHRFILGAAPGQETDHRNRNKLDNRRSNIYLCTRRQNLLNRGTNNKLLGIYFDRGKYVVRFKVHGRYLYFGRHKTLGEAKAKAQDVRPKMEAIA